MPYVAFIALFITGCSTITCQPYVSVRYAQLEHVLVSVAEEKEVGMVDYMETLTPSIKCTY